jgi:methylmalonyl-CoA mutase C-terminal domain/subunit
LEVIYTGRQQSPEQVAATALQEDVDVIGLSFLSGAHLTLMQKLMKRLRELDLEDKMVVVGGVIPKDDIPRLKELGVKEIFPVGSPMERIIESIKALGSMNFQ